MQMHFFVHLLICEAVIALGFPSLIIPSLFIIAMLFAIIVYGRKSYLVSEMRKTAEIRSSI